MPIEISGLKCDYCNWGDDSIPFSAYSDYIDNPCPNCGSNLLTQKEFMQCIKIIDRVARIERVLHALRWLNPLFYVRLLIGDKRKEKTVIIEYPKRETHAKV